MSDADRFAILYILLDREVETIYNRHLADTDKSVALRHVWIKLKNTYDYRDENHTTKNIVSAPLSRARQRGCIPFWPNLAIIRTGPATKTKWLWITQTF